MRVIQSLSCLTVAFLAATNSVFAHGLVICPSTPLSPPKGYVSCSLVFVIALFVMYVHFLGRWKEGEKLALHWRAVVSTISIALSLLLVFGAVSYVRLRLGRGFSPAFGIYRPLLGADFWGRPGFLFLLANSFIAAAFALVLGIFWLSLVGRKSIVKVLLLFWLFYLCALLPFIATGAFCHGWAGGYVLGDCAYRRDLLTTAAFIYARCHENRLPIGANNDEIWPKLKPYLTLPHVGHSPRVEETLEQGLACPIAYLFEREKEGISWNDDISGLTLDEVCGQAERPLFKCKFDGKWHRACCHKKFLGVILRKYCQIPKR